MGDNLKKFDHVVVLMMENRSFDNMAGWLYPKGKAPRGQVFDWVDGKRLSNPIPKNASDAWRKEVPVGRGSQDLAPTTDPGEEFRHINRQLYGTPTPQPGRRAEMKGFVQDYIEVLREEDVEATYQAYKTIMDGFTPQQVPVISTLAKQYGVCDRWFCSVPSQTWTNRSFFHAATSAGLVNNWPYINWLQNDTDTIFNRLSEAGLSWGVYYDKATVASLTMLIHFRKLAGHWNTNFHFMERFYSDAAKGTLPHYTFIEPRFNNWGGQRNDQHPPYSVAQGEQLIYDVYQALRKGKNWERTLFLITYDEHGGCYDHVPPPATTPPEKKASAGQEGFHFDRLGVRVCTVVVSPYIEPGTVFRAKNTDGHEVPLEHASMIKTLTSRWNLRPLTERDKQAVDIGQVLSLAKPRVDDPFIPKPQVPKSSLFPPKLSGLERDFAGIAAVRLGELLAMLVNAQRAKRK
ncbi:alkaline phosphatase family protein [Tumebacillus permanentifrigoris]|uniref:Phospholipase C n=1 Tax=Tumebacillus permanentifrigoris TaxID=378543 RepID=A0A316D3L3_9BACL|nr:alkaline phosphatase family protein [Tumebacillus permanentifrigoris]PWK03940.1 phospholipase C [Tumebacillus permanentifrigoris]